MQWLTRIQSIAGEYEQSAFYWAKDKFTMTAWGQDESFTFKINFWVSKMTSLQSFQFFLQTKVYATLFLVVAWNVMDSVNLWFACHSYLAMLHTGLLSE